MTHFNLSLATFVAISAAVALGQDAVDQVASASAARRERLLTNMGVHSDSRCVGISLVAATLLAGEAIADDQCDVPAELGRRIYQAAFRKESVPFHATLCLDNTSVAIESPKALDALATAVVDCYRARYLELIQTPAGIEKLRAAERDVLQNLSELDAILDAAAGQLVQVFVTGSRIFPDGSVQGTNHAILMVKTKAGERWVYDSNEPGTPRVCRFETGINGLTMKWSCRYKNTGLIANHRYRIVRSESFLAVVGKIERNGQLDLSSRTTRDYG